MAAVKSMLEPEDGLSDEHGRSRTMSTLSRVFRPDPTEEPHVFRPVSAVSCRNTVDSVVYPGHKEDPPLKYHPLCSFSFLVKIAQVLITIICAGLYTKGLNLQTNSITTQMFPNIVFASYLIITPVILVSYVLGQKMPELLIRIFNIVGSLLFLIAGLITAVTCITYMEEWTYMQQWTVPDHDTDEPNLCTPTPLSWCVVMLVAEGVLSIVNGILYIADVAYSVKRTLSYL